MGIPCHFSTADYPGQAAIGFMTHKALLEGVLPDFALNLSNAPSTVFDSLVKEIGRPAANKASQVERLPT
jgi:hypothetical protein